MGRADYVKHGDYNFICDKCGMKRKASTGRLQWDNLFVCPECFDVKHPQYEVRGILDNQTVPIARPDVVATMGTTTVKVAGSKNDITIDITSISGITDGDGIGIVLDNGSAHWTYSDGTPLVNTVTLGSYLPYPAAIGNTVYVPSINSETYVTATGITAAEL